MPFDLFDVKRLQRLQQPARPRRKSLRVGSPEFIKATARMDWYDRKQFEIAVTNAASRERRNTILGSIFASGQRKDLAEHLADDTDMPADQALNVLRIANAATPSKVPSLSERVGACGDIGALGVDGPQGKSTSTSFNELAAQIYASRKAKTR